MVSYCIHIFRRDYRLDDNTTLIEACKTHDIIIPIFIFDHLLIKTCYFFMSFKKSPFT